MQWKTHLGREAGVHKFMSYSVLLFHLIHTKKRSVLPAKKDRMPGECMKYIFQRAARVGLLPRRSELGSEQIPAMAGRVQPYTAM